VPDVNPEQTPENYEQLSITTTAGQDYYNVDTRTSDADAYNALSNEPRESHTYERV